MIAHVRVRACQEYGQSRPAKVTGRELTGLPLHVQEQIPRVAGSHP